MPANKPKKPSRKIKTLSARNAKDVKGGHRKAGEKPLEFLTTTTTK